MRIIKPIIIYQHIFILPVFEHIRNVNICKNCDSNT